MLVLSPTPVKTRDPGGQGGWQAAVGSRVTHGVQLLCPTMPRTPWFLCLCLLTPAGLGLGLHGCGDSRPPSHKVILVT